MLSQRLRLNSATSELQQFVFLGGNIYQSFIAAEVEIGENTFVITCMHLNHRTETTRLNEIVSIRNSLNDIFEKNTPQIWTGDFNALTKEDYSSDHWNEITEVRAKDNWELPQTDLTEKIKEYGFQAGDTAVPLSVWWL